MSGSKKKVFKDWSELVAHLAQVRSGKRVVFTNGCFDILHVGHVRYLQEAQAQGDFLVLGLNTDDSVRRLKGPERPINNEAARSELLAALECVDFVTFFAEETPLKLIETVKPEVLVKGGDYTIDKIVGADFVLSRGGEVKALQFANGYSTSSIIEKIRTL